MGTIHVSGGKQLHGETIIQGSKNGALPLMAAAVLHKGMTVLHNCPRIQDVECMRLLLEDLGCKTLWEGHTLCIDASSLKKNELNASLAEKMRGSVLLMGSLLARCREVILPFPGGCVIGKRPVNYHLDLMREMGAEVLIQEERMVLRTGTLNGVQSRLRFPSVGATENAILAAVLANGSTCLSGCAQEPEITELCRFLNQKGADIKERGTTIQIRGCRELHDSEYTLMPDRIVAGTYLLAAAAAGGEAVLHQVPVSELNTVTAFLVMQGCELNTYQETDKQVMGKTMTIKSSCFPNQNFRIETAPYPGFPTDLQSPLLAATAAGRESICRIRENLFENRFGIADELRKMGADIQIAENEAQIRGKFPLHAADLTAGELRGGAALVLAALTAQGTSRIAPDDAIRRGYEDIVRDLKALGADIRTEEGKPEDFL